MKITTKVKSMAHAYNNSIPVSCWTCLTPYVGKGVCPGFFVCWTLDEVLIFHGGSCGWIDDGIGLVGEWKGRI